MTAPGRGKRLAFRILILLFGAGLLELAAATLLARTNGAWLSRAELVDHLAPQAQPDGEADRLAETVLGGAPEEAIQKRRWIQHPFLGFVRNPEAEYHELNRVRVTEPVNQHGFFGPSPVTEQRDDTFTVALTGGSVALELYLYARPTLEAELSALPAAAGKRVELICLALGGMKQPQQLLALNYFLVLGAHYDLVLSLDGFNEVALSVAENLWKGVYPHYPRSWAAYSALSIDVDTATLYGRLAALGAERQRSGERIAKSPLRHSYFALALWQSRQRQRQAEIVALEQRLRKKTSDGVLGPQQRGPAYPQKSSQEVSHDLVRLWRKAAVQAWQLCRANGIAYHHYLQPNQYVKDSKPYSDWELEYAIRIHTDYAKRALLSYPHLQAAAAEAAAAGAPMHDMTGIYQGVEDHTYKDHCCHLTDLGNELLAKAMVARIAAATPGS